MTMAKLSKIKEMEKNQLLGEILDAVALSLEISEGEENDEFLYKLLQKKYERIVKNLNNNEIDSPHLIRFLDIMMECSNNF